MSESTQPPKYSQSSSDNAPKVEMTVEPARPALDEATLPPVLGPESRSPAAPASDTATLPPPDGVTEAERQCNAPGFETLTLPPVGVPSDPQVTLPAPPGYAIERELGRGGMGVVYLARQHGLNRAVALKMVLSGAHASPQDLVRFLQEGEAVAQLRHPNVVQIYEVDTHEGRPYLVLEFCDGGSLDRKLAGQPIKPEEAAQLVGTLARAVQAAHDQGIVHRDLKPQNVLLLADGTPKVTDFGLAKLAGSGNDLTASGAIMGTPSYMAPEQAEGKGKQVGPLADVYALGAILYESLTGRPPFRAATPLDTILQVVSEEPVHPRLLNPQVPKDLETIALKCLQKVPARRYGSAEALAEELERWLRGEPILARPVGRLERGVKWVRRNKTVAALSSLAAIAIVAGLIFSITFAIGQRAAREAADVQANNARIEKERADENAHESRRRLARQYLINGNRLLEADDMAGAMVWYTEALALEDDDPDRSDVHRRRIGCMLREHPQLVANWLLPASKAKGIDPIISYDGHTVLALIDEQVVVHDILSGRRLYDPLTLSVGVSEARFSEHDRFILAGNHVVKTKGNDSLQGVYRLWNRATGEPVGEELKLDGGRSNQYPLIDPDGKWVAIPLALASHSFGEPARLVLWEVMSGKTQPIDLPPGFFLNWLSPDRSRALAIRGSQKPAVQGRADPQYAPAQLQLVDTATWKPIGPNIEVQRTEDRRDVFAGFSADGPWYVVDEVKAEATIYDLSGKPVGPPIKLPGLHGAGWLPGHEIFLITKDSVHFASTSDAKIVRSFSVPHSFTNVVASDDGHRLAVWDRNVPSFTFYDVDGKKLSPRIPIRTALNQPSFSDDGTQFAYVDGDRLVRVFDFARPNVLNRSNSSEFHGSRYLEQSDTLKDQYALVDANELRVIRMLESGTKNDPVVYDSQINEDGRYQYQLADDGTITLRDIDNDSIKKIPTHFKIPPDRHLKLRWSNATTLLLEDETPDQPRLQQLDAITGELGPIIEGPRNPEFPAWIAPRSGKVVYWNSSESGHHFRLLATGKELLPPFRSIPVLREPHDCLVLTFNEEFIFLKVGDTLWLWSEKDGFRQIENRFDAIPVDHLGLAILSKDGRRLVQWGGPKLNVIDVERATVLGRIAMPSEIVQVEIDPKTAALVVLGLRKNLDGRSNDSLVRIWDLNTGQPRTGYLDAGEGSSFHLSPDGKLLHAGRRLWDAATGSPISSEFAFLQQGSAVCVTPNKLCMRTEELLLPAINTSIYGVTFVGAQTLPVMVIQPIAPIQRAVSELRQFVGSLACRSFDQTESLSLESDEELARDWKPLPEDKYRKDRKYLWYAQQLFLGMSNRTHLRFLCEQLQKREPKDYSWPSYLGHLARDEKKLPLAIDRYSQALRLATENKASADILVYRAEAYYELRDWAKADRDYTDALAKEQSTEQAQFGRGMSRIQQKRWAEAIIDLEMIKFEDEQEDIYFDRIIAYTFAFSGKIDSFRAKCDSYLKPLFGERMVANATDQERARIFMVLTDPMLSPHVKRASDWFAAHHDKENRTGFDKLLNGGFLYRQGEYAEAVKFLESLEMDNTFVLSDKWPFLVMAYHRLNQPEKAKKALDELKQARQKSALDPNPYEMLNLEWMSREVDAVLAKPWDQK